MRTKEKVDSKDVSLKDIVDRVSSVFSRLHVLVVGPGLSRDELMLDSAKELIFKAREKDMAIVIDADGLYLVQQHPETVKDYKKAVLTPNVVEFQRLCEKMVKRYAMNKKIMWLKPSLYRTLMLKLIPKMK